MEFTFELQNAPLIVDEEILTESKPIIKKKRVRRSNSESPSKRKKKNFIKIKDEFKECSGRQMFRKKWLELPEFKDWLSEAMFPFHGFCSVCKVNITAGKSDLLTHSRSRKHTINVAAMKKANADMKKANTAESVTAIVDEFGDTHLLRLIDMRSDSLSVPTFEMKMAMIEVDAGDSSFGTDKPVTELEEFVAQMLNKEAGLIFPTHVMSNFAAVLAHCQARGSAVILGEESDIQHSNSEALVKFGGLHLCPVKEFDNGTFCLETVEDMFKSLDFRYPLSCLVCIECPHTKKGGKVLPMEWIDELGTLCISHGSSLHCDGTRLVNASLAKSVSLLRFAAFCDSVTIALDKSLGAPVGAVLVGSKSFIESARHIREFLGGKIHQAGTFAAAGFFALNQLLSNVDYDHDKAKAIAMAVARENSSVISVDFESVETNIIHLECNTELLNAYQLKDRLSSVDEEETPYCLNENIIILVNALNANTVCMMVHNKITDSEVTAIIRKLLYVIKEYSDDKKLK